MSVQPFMIAVGGGKVGKKLHEISKKYLSVSLNFGGMIFYSEDVCTSVNKMSLFRDI